MIYSSRNPFAQPFEKLGDRPKVTTKVINSLELDVLVQALSLKQSREGRFILLRSSRAGFGKTHLLERLRQSMVRTHEFIPIEPLAGKPLDATFVMNSVIRRFSRIVSSGGGMTILDFLARRIFAIALEPLIKSEEVPSEDAEEAVESLRKSPVETFDFHDPEAITAQWAMSNFELLRPSLTAELCKRTRGNTRAISWWIRCLFDFSSAALTDLSRDENLFESVTIESSSGIDAHEKLVALIKLISAVSCPVFVLDETESYYGSPELALKTCSLLSSLHQSCEKLSVIVSVNSDVWETGFVPRLSGGLKDRITENVVDLKPLPQGQVRQLLQDRSDDLTEQILERLDLDVGVVYARGVLRESSSFWGEFSKVDGESQKPQVEPDEPISLVTPTFNKSGKISEPSSSDITFSSKKDIVAKLGAAISQRESNKLKLEKE